MERDDSSEDLVFSSPSEEQGDNVSSPVQREGVARSESAHLHSLVLPVPKGWSQCGYLWLRMKLPNNRYAWTFIVSLLGVWKWWGRGERGGKEGGGGGLCVCLQNCMKKLDHGTVSVEYVLTEDMEVCDAEYGGLCYVSMEEKTNVV